MLSDGRLPLKQPIDDISIDTQDTISRFLPQRAVLQEKTLKLQSLRSPVTNGPSAVNKVDFTEDEFVRDKIRASQHPATTVRGTRCERGGRGLGRGPYTAATQPCCSGS